MKGSRANITKHLLQPVESRVRVRAGTKTEIVGWSLSSEWFHTVELFASYYLYVTQVLSRFNVTSTLTFHQSFSDISVFLAFFLSIYLSGEVVCA